MAFEYQQLTNEQRLVIINSRVRELEQQHAELEVRIDAPDLSYTPTDQDKERLALLESSIQTLHDMASSVNG